MGILRNLTGGEDGRVKTDTLVQMKRLLDASFLLVLAGYITGTGVLMAAGGLMMLVPIVWVEVNS